MNKKVLVVVTNVSKYSNVNRATGLWLGEAVHFVEVMENNGFEVTYVSPLGGYTPIDPHSIEPEMMSDLDWKFYTDRKFMNALGTTVPAKDINYNDYSIIYYTGGHGVIWDFPNDKKLQEIAIGIWNNGGIVSAVCHGLAGLLNIKDNSGEYLIKDKKVTGFSDSEEKEVQLDKLVPYLTEDELVKRGAKYSKTDNWGEYAVADGRLVTGQNPTSGAAVAREILKVLQK